MEIQMQIKTGPNSAELALETGEIFYFRSNFLKNFKNFDWCIIPPQPLGSPIMRVLYKSYFGMRRVSAADQVTRISVRGIHERGNFHSIELQKGQNVFVNAHHLAGFSGQLGGLHTHIKLLNFTFWILGKHFFSVFSGPGTVLLYCHSPFEETSNTVFHPSQILAFDVSRIFRLTPPEPMGALSQLLNLFVSDITWEFITPGLTVAECHIDTGESEDRSGWDTVKEIFWHLISFWKF
jgi:hypothetical protein